MEPAGLSPVSTMQGSHMDTMQGHRTLVSSPYIVQSFSNKEKYMAEQESNLETLGQSEMMLFQNQTIAQIFVSEVLIGKSMFLQKYYTNAYIHTYEYIHTHVCY